MKKTILFLCSLACVNVALGQQLTVQQGRGYLDGAAFGGIITDTRSTGNVATVTQEGGVIVNNLQYALQGTVNINQTAGGTNDNNLTVYQYSTDNVATVDQKGSANTLELIQANIITGNLGGNVATINQSGSNNSLLGYQVTGDGATNGNTLTINQSGEGSLVEAYSVSKLAGNTIDITQDADFSQMRVVVNGSRNEATLVQSGAYNVVYLAIDNRATVNPLGNTASVIQNGTGNVFQSAFTGDNNIINVEQIGNNNIIVKDDTWATGILSGNNNTINAIQHGDNQIGYINLGSVHNSTINILSVAY